MSSATTLLAEVAPFALLALAGAPHCAGMCGGFSTLVAADTRCEGGRFLSGQLAYLAGKTATYVTLGLALSLGARALGGEAGVGGDLGRVAGWAEAGLARQVLAWLTGGALLVLGLRSLGWLPSPSSGRLAAPAALLARPFAHVRRLGGVSGALGIGVLTGLLPCGLSWAALLLSITVHPLSASLGLVVFGLATGPALVFTAGAGAVLLRRWSGLGRKLTGPILIALGAMVLWRGGFGRPHADSSAGHGSCCDTELATDHLSDVR